MNIVSVNGRTYRLPDGGTTEVIGTIVYHNGKQIVDCDEFDEKEITIVINGDNNTINSAAGNITVNGTANNVSTKSGDIEISGDANDVTTTSGDVEVHGDIKGNCHTVSGDIDTGRKSRKLGLFNFIMGYRG